jgi:hypothetical protein
MKKSFKAILASALIYPGLGHLLLKHYIQGLLIIASFSLPLWFMLSDVITKTNEVITQVQNGQVSLNSNAIAEAINHSSGADMQTLSIYSYVMLAVWIIGILDVYRITRKATTSAPSKV